MTTHSPVVSQDRVFIQQLNSETLTLYDELKKTDKRLKESSFYASKSKNVNPKVMIEILEELNNNCECKKLEYDIQKIVKDLQSMYTGETRMFVRHACGPKLELVCAAVNMYRTEDGGACGKCKNCMACKKLTTCGNCNFCQACENPIKCRKCDECDKGCEKPISCGECRACRKCKSATSCGRCEECQKCEVTVACDYLIATYSYKNIMSKAKIETIFIIGGLGLVALNVNLASCIETKDLRFIIGAVAAALGAGTSLGYIIYKSPNISINIELENLLEAAFVHELIQRGFASLDDGKLYLELKD